MIGSAQHDARQRLFRVLVLHWQGRIDVFQRAGLGHAVAQWRTRESHGSCNKSTKVDSRLKDQEV
jgi:hypothetical protein